MPEAPTDRVETDVLDEGQAADKAAAAKTADMAETSRSPNARPRAGIRHFVDWITGERVAQLLILIVTLVVLAIDLARGEPDSVTVALLVLLIAAAALPRVLELNGPLGVGIRLTEVRELEIQVREDLTGLPTGDRLKRFEPEFFQLAAEEPATGLALAHGELLRRLASLHRYLLGEPLPMVSGFATAAKLRRREIIPPATAELTYQVLALSERALASERVPAALAVELVRLADTAYQRLTGAVLLDLLARRALEAKGFEIEPIPGQPLERLAFFRARRGEEILTVAARYVVKPQSDEFVRQRDALAAQAAGSGVAPPNHGIAIVPDGLETDRLSTTPNVTVLQLRELESRSGRPLLAAR
jgi:hypothetical protein